MADTEVPSWANNPSYKNLKKEMCGQLQNLKTETRMQTNFSKETSANVGLLVSESVFVRFE